MKEISCGFHPKCHKNLDIELLSDVLSKRNKLVFEFFTIYIIGYEESRAKAVKSIRDISGICYQKLDLKQATKIVDTLPHEYKDGLTAYSAIELAKKMIGAKLKVRIDGIEMITDAQAIEEGLI